MRNRIPPILAYVCTGQRQRETVDTAGTSAIVAHSHRRLPPDNEVWVVGVAGGGERRLVTALCRWHLRLAVRDPELRRSLTPDYQAMCKRQVVAWHYYQAMQKPSVHLITEAIDHVEPRGVVTTDGALHELDLLVLATGFEAGTAAYAPNPHNERALLRRDPGPLAAEPSDGELSGARGRRSHFARDRHP